MISNITVKISDKNNSLIGTGILINQEGLGNLIYLITAAHNLYEDSDNFNILKNDIVIHIYNSSYNIYNQLELKLNEKLVLRKDYDLGIIYFDKREIGFEIPVIELIKRGNAYQDFMIKGFSNATRGEEIDSICTEWKQDDVILPKFNLTLLDNYNEYNMGGFSGSGVFVDIQGGKYLLGLVLRYRPEERGKVIYCQYLDTINEILRDNYLPILSFSYLGKDGINRDFFQSKVEKSIANLGERYSEKLNFKLPISHRFDELAFNNHFKNRFLALIDTWLLDVDTISSIKTQSVQDINDELYTLKEKLVSWEKENPVKIETIIDLDWFFNELEILEQNIDKVEKEVSEKYYKFEQNNSDKCGQNYFGEELSWLRKISNRNYQFKRDFKDSIDFKLVNNPFLIIEGGAGSGKSHLLGDIANDRIKQGLPIILLVGQTFNNNSTIEQNILNQLDLTCDFSNFLSNLDDIGKQIDSRILILIDAINETINADLLWKTQMSGFINLISKYKYIGVVFSIRDIYRDYVLPSDIRERVQVIEHKGFKGNEYEALKLFCEFYNLDLPKFPILSPEFSNPLFLKLCCSGISNSGQKDFPSGFNGIYKVFENYIDSIYIKIQSKPEYKLRRRIVWEAIDCFLNQCSQNQKTYLEIEECVNIFSEKFSITPNLLQDLIEEGLFIKSIINKYHQNSNGNYLEEPVEVLYFSYQRLGDYLTAKKELDLLGNIDNIKAAFQPDGKFGQIFNDSNSYYSYTGLLEAFSVILPEKYTLEIYEVYDWLFNKSLNFIETDESDFHKLQIRYNCRYITNDLFLNSLKWRSIESIDSLKITGHFQTQKFQYSMQYYDDYLELLIELSCVENHPLNSDRLFNILIGITMADRDAFWQKFVHIHSQKDDEGNAFCLKRLLDFAWQSGVSNIISDETCRLTGQTLIWVLASTNRPLRDKATKALVNLFEQKPLVLLEILIKFKNVNDLSILERIYAVIYGVVLRTDSDEGITKLAQCTYNIIFKQEKPIQHILLRDYARNIIEYALYKNLDIKVIQEKIRPPYKSKIPKIPTIKQLEKYKKSFESQEFKENPDKVRLHNKPFFSVLEWDFGRYVVDNKIDDFYPISFTQESLYKAFLKNMNKNQKDWIKLYEGHLKLIYKFERYDYHIKSEYGEDYYNEKISELKENTNNITKQIVKLFPKNSKFIKNEILPYIETKQRVENQWTYYQTLDPEPFKRWIVERVYKLGYDIEKHFDYDRHYSNYIEREYYYDRERISKKYQWIALYEILAVIADNYQMKDDGKLGYYKGAWQMYLRDIDPAYIKENQKEEDKEILFFDKLDSKEWFEDDKYQYWNENPNEWVLSTEDLPKFESIITKKDDLGNEWLHLQKFIDWKEPKRFGDDKYDRQRKELWYLIQGYLCKKKDKDKILNHLKEQNFWGRWMPENKYTASCLMNREKFWSPAYNDSKEKGWINIPETNFKIMVANEGAKGSMGDDKSDANQKYDIPCRAIFEGLNLQYSSKDGDLINTSKEVIVTNDNYKGVLIRKKELLKYLEDNGLFIFWTIIAEKNAKMDKSFLGHFIFGEFSGLYWLEDTDIKGDLIFKKNTRNY